MQQINFKSETTELFTEGVKEVILRTGDAPNVYDPEKVAIYGQIDAPLRYYKTRKHLQENAFFDPAQTHVIVDRERMTIKLIRGESDKYADEITGTLQIAPVFTKLGINTNQFRTPNEIGMLLRQNQHLFVEREQGAKVIAGLLKFEGEVKAKLESEKRVESGGKRQLTDVVVESDAPKNFRLNLPLFKGDKPAALSITIVFDTTGHNIICCLESLEAIELIEAQKNERISANIADFETDNITVIEI